MFLLYELEIRAYITHTVILCKVEEVPSPDRPISKKASASPSLIQAIGLSHECGQNFSPDPLAGCP